MTKTWPRGHAPRALHRRQVLAGLGAAGGAFVLWPVWSTTAQAKTARFSASGAGGEIDHAAFDALLARHLRPGSDGINRVAYRAWQGGDHQTLKAYIRALSAVRITQHQRPVQYAFWLNLYNAVTVDVVLDHYPVRSIRDIRLGGGGLFRGGPWQKPLVEVDGTTLSLDNIEHDILRTHWRDPRVHYGVNCASIGCPNLQKRAFGGARLEAMLDAGARDYVNHSRGLSFQNGQATASRIYDWFDEDFGGRNGLVPHWRQHARGETARALSGDVKIAGFAYDWSLNDG